MCWTPEEREAGVVPVCFGLTDGQSKTMSKLRHPSRSQVLRDYLD